MSTSRELWVLTGGNGAGKSTFYETMLRPRGIPFINADVLAKEFFPEAPEENSLKAAKIAEETRYSLLQQGQSYCFETVFSHPSKVDFIAAAKGYGYTINLVFIHLNNPSLNKARVSQRTALGGHYVPDDKVEQRIPRTIANVKRAIPLCNHVRILDNSRTDRPFMQVAKVVEGIPHALVNPLPDWAHAILYD